MDDVEDARSETSDEDPDYTIHDDEYFHENMEALIESNDPSDNRVLNHMVVTAAQTNDVNFYIGLLGRDYQLQVLNDKGQTALHIAFYHDSKLILEYGIDDDWDHQDSHVNYTDCNGLSHLHIMCDFWSEESDNLAEKYLKSGADVNARFEIDPNGLRDGFTPLHMCAVGRSSDNDCFKLLLKYGANVVARDKLGRTPLHLVCSVYNFDATLERIVLLLEKGSDVNANDDEGNTPLHSVFIVGCIEKFPYAFSSEKMYKKYKLLRDHHADVTAINKAGNTVLHCVIMNLKHFQCGSAETSFDDSLHVKIIDEIFSSREGIDVNVKNNAGITFVQIAVSMLSVDIVAHCFYDDPAFLPNLEVVENVLTIVSQLLDGGFEFTDDDKLALVRFILQDNRNSSWMNALNRHKMEAYLHNLLNFGSRLQVQRAYRPMAIALLAQNKLSLKNKMHKFVKKWLRYKLEAGLYYDDFVNDDVLDLDWDTYEFDIESKAYFILRPNLVEKMKVEHVLMETTHLNDNVTLLSVLKQHPNDIYQRIKDVDLKNITNKFSIYKNIVEGHLTKSLIRNFIEKLVNNDHLKKLLFSALPDVCSRMILFYLNNEDILNVLSATMVKNQ